MRILLATTGEMLLGVQEAHAIVENISLRLLSQVYMV